MTISRLRRARLFDAEPIHDQTSRGGKIVVYERVTPGIDYGIGGDWAYGIRGRDRDSICVFGKFPSSRHEKGYRVAQVCQIYGWWGERFHRVLYAVLRYYNTALLVGERQCGLASMRRLIDDYGYRRIYYDRAEERKGRDRRDILGIHRGRNDVTLTNFRLAVAQGDVDLRSRELIEEMAALQWVSRTKEKSDSRTEDAKLVPKLTTGGSPDLVMSAVYAWHAARCLHLFEPPEEREPDELPADMRTPRRNTEPSFGRRR